MSGCIEGLKERSGNELKRGARYGKREALLRQCLRDAPILAVKFSNARRLIEISMP